MASYEINSRFVEVVFKNVGKRIISLPYIYNMPLIKYYLKANDMPLTKFCDKVGIDYFRFNDLMTGERTMIDFMKLKKYLNI